MNSARLESPSEAIEFSDFVSGIENKLRSIKARLLHSEESEANGTIWWFSFTWAACIYRVSFQRQTGVLILEKAQGSFVPNAQPIWKRLESRSQADASYEGSIDLVGSLLTRFSA